jgi:hypothetical protein
MKKYIFIYITLILWSLTACSKLEETPFSGIFTANFYKTASDAEAALTAVYGAIADVYNGPSPLMVSDFSADHVYPRPVVGRNTYTLFTYDPTYSIARSFNREFESPVQIWRLAYTGIERANWVLERVPTTNMDTKRRDEILGEALFLRAFFHWTLTKNFGEIVIKTKASSSLENATVAKSNMKDVYKQIYADLEEATNKLPSYTISTVKGRTSKEVAIALHAKAALYNEDWALALQKAQAVISSGRYALMPNVRDVYDVSKEDLARQENMFAFEAESYTPGRTSQVMGLYGPPSSNGPEYGKQTFGSIFVYPSFYASFNPLDKRRELMDTTYIDVRGNPVRQRNITPITPNGILVKKYQDPNSIGSSHAVNIPILRLPDVYLIAAEAEGRLNGGTATAYNFVNVIRRRAGLPDLQAGLGKDAFVAAILQERAWELFAEGDRWYDLTRTNTFLTVIPRAVNDVFPVRAPQAKHRYFPIPQDEINANSGVTQNTGW